MTREKQNQPDLFKADTSWFHIFKEIVRNETWAKMSGSAKAVYPVVKSYANWEHGGAFPSIDTLEQYSGVSRPSVVKALRELEELGLLKKVTTRGKGSAYSIVEKFNVRDEEGNGAASVSFDYIPASTAAIMAEFKRMLSEGLVAQDGKNIFIKVDSITLNMGDVVINAPVDKNGG